MTELLAGTIDVVATLLIVAGGIFILIGGIGVLRFPDFYTRIHASSLTDTMATLALFTGLILHAGLTLASVKLFAIMLFLLLTGPTATYALANAALMSGLKPLHSEPPTPDDEVKA